MTATITERPASPIERTEHPHVVTSATVLSGEPIVEGTRLAVRHILIHYRDVATSPEEIAVMYGLTPGQVHDALSYAFDHMDEIKVHIERNKIRNVMRDQDLVMVDRRLIERSRLDKIDVPPGTPIYTWETLPADVAG